MKCYSAVTLILFHICNFPGLHARFLIMFIFHKGFLSLTTMSVVIMTFLHSAVQYLPAAGATILQAESSH